MAVFFYSCANMENLNDIFFYNFLLVFQLFFFQQKLRFLTMEFKF